MLVSELFTHINSAFRGTDDNSPTSGDDFDNWLLTVNRLQDEWARDTNNVWGSLFSTVSLSPVVTFGTQSYDLPTDVIQPSDKVTVTTLTGEVVDFVLCEPQERDQYDNSVYISGISPQKLTFNQTIKTDDKIIGGTIKVSGYFLPAELTTGASEVKVNDPYWLAYAAASELAFNDLTYESKAAELSGKANARYKMMVNANRRGTHNNPRTARTAINRILDTTGEGEL